MKTILLEEIREDTVVLDGVEKTVEVIEFFVTRATPNSGASPEYIRLMFTDDEPNLDFAEKHYKFNAPLDDYNVETNTHNPNTDPRWVLE